MPQLASGGFGQTPSLFCHQRFSWSIFRQTDTKAVGVAAWGKAHPRLFCFALAEQAHHPGVGRVEIIGQQLAVGFGTASGQLDKVLHLDRKSTRLNSSHVAISYAVFCLKKKITNEKVRA